MADIEEYLSWRGDLTFKQDSFNDVDNGLLSALAYVDMKGIVPGSDSKASITLAEANGKFFEEYTEQEIMATQSFISETPFLMKKMAESRRFSEVKLSKYMEIIDEEAQMQFAAFHIDLGEGTTYIVFKGTDDTLVGWKEDFNMSFISPVPSQHTAVEYVNNTVKAGEGKLRFGGHSKGGNLAIYAAVHCDGRIRRRILEVYNNDGPGFDRNMVDSKEYKEMLPKIKTIVPYHSVVGMLLEHEEDYMVVESSQSGIMQHDIMSWQVLGREFVKKDAVSKASGVLNKALSNWINSLDNLKREEFVEALFGIIQASGAKTLSDIRTDRFSSASAAFKLFKTMDRDTRVMIMKILHSLTGEFDKVIREEKGKKFLDIV